MFWIGLGTGLMAGGLGLIIYAIRTAKELKEDLKEKNYEKV